jgi:hypothetical protein
MIRSEMAYGKCLGISLTTRYVDAKADVREERGPVLLHRDVAEGAGDCMGIHSML